MKSVGSAVCPGRGALAREYSWIQFQKGREGNILPLRHCSLFPLFDKCSQSELASAGFLSSEGPEENISW